MPLFAKGQLSVEMVIISVVMIGLLLSVYLVNDSLRTQWEDSRQMLIASSSANRVAMAINRAAAGGNGAKVTFFNEAEADVASVSIFDRRSVRAYAISGRYASAPLVTNNTNIAGAIPTGRLVTFINSGGQIGMG